jgi:hypothetical protein
MSRVFNGIRQRGAGIAAAALCTLLVAACGPGGDNTLAIPTPFGGLVKVPAAAGGLAKPTLLTRVRDFILPRALALTGMDTVDAGVPVSLYAIDAAGNRFGSILDQGTTASDGSYAVTLPSWDLYDRAHPWVVAVGDPADGTLMRRLVDDLAASGIARDIDPASEAALQLLLGDAAGSRFGEISPSEIAELNDQVAAAAASVTGLDIAEVTALALRAAQDDEATQRKVVAITSTPANTRPVARAGIDFRMTTGDILNLVANAEDADGDPVFFLWSVDEAPQISTIDRNPPIGRRLTFQPDVDGAYRLKLVVTDENLGVSPPDYATIIATTAPVQLTANDTVDSQGAMTRGRDFIVYTLAVRDAATNSNYSDVLVQAMTDAGTVGTPSILLPPGAGSAGQLFKTVEGHPAISADHNMITYATDMASPGVGGGDFEVVGVSLSRPGSPFWVTQNTSFDTQPDVQCESAARCVITFVNDADPAGTQVVAATFVDEGAGFFEESRAQISTALADHFGPRLSLDAQWVVFVGRDPVEGDLEIFRALADGSMAVPEQLTDNTVDDEQPEPNEDATVITYRSGTGVWVLRTDTPVPLRVSGTQLTASHPSISADGSVVAMVGVTDLGSDLFSVQSDGTLLTQLTTDGTVSQPRVSADGSRILFRSARDGDHDFYMR